MNNPILERHVQKEKIKVNIEKLFYSLKGDPKVTINDQVRDDVKFIFRKFITDSSRVRSTRTNKALHPTLQNLTKDTTIKIRKFDQGNGVAILDTNDYNAKLDAIIGDKPKFQLTSSSSERRFFCVLCEEIPKKALRLQNDSESHTIR